MVGYGLGCFAFWSVVFDFGDMNEGGVRIGYEDMKGEDLRYGMVW